MNYKVLFSRKFMSSFNSFRENGMIFFEFLIFDRILQGFCELLRHFTGAFLALWCKLTAFKSCNCNLSIENQYGMTFDTVLTSNSFSYKWCSIFICEFCLKNINTLSWKHAKNLGLRNSGLDTCQNLLYLIYNQFS